MNTVSLVLNGRTTAYISQLPPKQRSTLTRAYSAPITPSTTRPSHRRTLSDSPGWYNTDNGMTLDDFALRLDTTLARLERWQGRCAQNVVMALMRPTPLVLFVFNPVSLLLLVALVLVWRMWALS